MTGGSYYFLDLTALGRQEDWEEPKGRAAAHTPRAPTSRINRGGAARLGRPASRLRLRSGYRTEANPVAVAVARFRPR